MTSMFILFGSIGLTIYIIVDLIRKRFDNILRRLIIYSFIFYLIIVAHLTIGNIQIPPSTGFVSIQLIPFHFISDWFLVGQAGDWFFWNSVKLSFYNLIMLYPLGVYYGLLFNSNSLKNTIKFVFLTSLTIETLQLILTSLGLLFRRGFDVDDLILNTIGGVIGYLSFRLIKKYSILIKSRKKRYNLTQIKDEKSFF